jgi:hypothetical protein
MDLKKLVMFCILMEGHEGIKGKAPSYIMEKFDLASDRCPPEEMFGHLDKNNQAKYKAWLKTWHQE